MSKYINSDMLFSFKPLKNKCNEKAFIFDENTPYTWKQSASSIINKVPIPNKNEEKSSKKGVNLLTQKLLIDKK